MMYMPWLNIVSVSINSIYYTIVYISWYLGFTNGDSRPGSACLVLLWYLCRYFGQ
jgi:hypothetical protein